MSEKKILVVDDEKAIVNLLKQAFTRAGFSVVTAESAEAALTVLEQEEIFVMFLDLNLPGMNGIETLKKLRSIFQDKYKTKIPEIVITGYASEESEKETQKFLAAQTQILLDENNSLREQLNFVKKPKHKGHNGHNTCTALRLVQCR